MLFCFVLFYFVSVEYVGMIGCDSVFSVLLGNELHSEVFLLIVGSTLG